MRIGLIDVDGGKRYPNIALMKISAWHKSQGDDVSWYEPFDGWYDKVYLSKVFSFSPDYDYVINATEVVRGGSGYCIELVDGKEVFHKERDIQLPAEVEHMYPDYSLYPALTEDTAFGFMTRGCPRGCSFCIVGEKEGLCSRKVADLKEFWAGQRNIVLNDPNILACKDWKNLLQQLIDSKAWVDLSQGLDIRMMTPEKAEMLGRVKCKELHFAWDRWEDKDKILPKFKMLQKPLKKLIDGHRVSVYTLTNYDTTIEQDLERIYTLREMGYWAYITIYDKEHCPAIYRKLARWVNNRFVFQQTQRFEDYTRKKVSTDTTNQLSIF